MKVIVISGPTASGKTSTSLALARKFGGEIVNFDSLLLYKEINIGTAKPTLEERKLIPHHMVDVRNISHPMNAADYAQETLSIVETLLSQKKIVYLVGGSGFYLQALLKGMYDSPKTPEHVIERSRILYEREGIAPFIKILQDNDPLSSERYHFNDHYRIRRAVEHWWANGTPFSQERSRKDESNQNLKKFSNHDWDILHLHLDLPKDEHHQIIKDRTRKMLDDGLEKEVRTLLDQGYTGLEKPLQSIGYKEMLAYLFGVMKSETECYERIVISTRQLAKSQRTWFKKDSFKLTFHPLGQQADLTARVEDFLRT
jgi:tRNA dimethylallyltransferase